MCFDKNILRIYVWKLFGVLGSKFYWHSVVGGVINCTGVIYGVTLPVLKYEIEDFFFARLGTGRTHRCSLRHNVCRHATLCTDAYTIIKI